MSFYGDVSDTYVCHLRDVTRALGVESVEQEAEKRFNKNNYTNDKPQATYGLSSVGGFVCN